MHFRDGHELYFSDICLKYLNSIDEELIMKPESGPTGAFNVQSSQGTEVNPSAGLNLGPNPTANFSLGFTHSTNSKVSYTVTSWTTSSHRVGRSMPHLPENALSLTRCKYSGDNKREPKLAKKRRHSKELRIEPIQEDQKQDMISVIESSLKSEDLLLNSKEVASSILESTRSSTRRNSSHRAAEAGRHQKSSDPGPQLRSRYQWLWGTQGETKKLTPDLKHSLKRHMVVHRVIPINDFPTARVKTFKDLCIAKEKLPKHVKSKDKPVKVPHEVVAEYENARRKYSETRRADKKELKELRELLSFDFLVQVSYFTP